jgi:hypothetical protein
MKYPIKPCAKPRMTRADKWKKRPAVVKYWAFKDLCNYAGIKFNNGDGVIFRVEMPKSWSAATKEVMSGEPHMQRPDSDNFLKGLMDAVCPEDSHLWCPIAVKVWAYESSIEILPLMEVAKFACEVKT